MTKPIFILLWLSLLLSTCWAHPTDEWFVSLETKASRLEGVFRVPSDQVELLEEKPIAFRVGDKPLTLVWSVLGDDEDGREKLALSAELPKEADELAIEVPVGLLDENQSLVGFIRFEGMEPTTLLVGPGETETFKGLTEARRPASVTGFLKLGLVHILEGFDHLLFLFCLLIAGGTVKHFLVVVTAFTLGHSVTLAASVLGLVSLPPQITETTIALSIVIAALLNIPWLKKDTPPEDLSSIKSRGLLAGGFGLIHGLGFAGILKEIGVQGGGVAAPLLGFNLGVELGQLALLALFVPLLMAVNKWDKRVPFLIFCSCLAALVGSYWVVERLGIL